jgi:hypothetical protein
MAPRSAALLCGMRLVCVPNSKRQARLKHHGWLGVCWQFFITLDKTEWLDRKHSIFGKVTGDTIYNVADLGKLETDGNDRPTEPMPHIKRVDVIWNPFDDIVPRQTMTAPSQLHQKRKRKQKKNLVSTSSSLPPTPIAAVCPPSILTAHSSLYSILTVPQPNS